MTTNLHTLAPIWIVVGLQWWVMGHRFAAVVSWVMAVVYLVTTVVETGRAQAEALMGGDDE